MWYQVRGTVERGRPETTPRRKKEKREREEQTTRGKKRATEKRVSGEGQNKSRTTTRFHQNVLGPRASWSEKTEIQVEVHVRRPEYANRKQKRTSVPSMGVQVVAQVLNGGQRPV